MIGSVGRDGPAHHRTICFVAFADGHQRVVGGDAENREDQTAILRVSGHGTRSRQAAGQRVVLLLVESANARWFSRELDAGWCRAEVINSCLMLQIPPQCFPLCPW